MAERRMFAKTIIDSDAFLDMPTSTQAFYFHLGMRADDDGFINNPKKIQKIVGGNDDDFKLLIAKRFIIPFESGVVVIKHWKIHNYIQSDRYKPTLYQEEKRQLVTKDNKGYTMLESVDNPTMYTECVQDVDTGKVRLGKDRLGKVSKGRKIVTPKPKQKPTFKPPTLEEVSQYCKDRNNNVNPIKFIDFYTSKGWLIGKTKMVDWQASVRTWEQKEEKKLNHEGREIDDAINNINF